MLAALISLLSGFIHMILGVNTPGQFPPPLPHDKELEYFKRLEGGDNTVRNELILHNLRLVSHIVRKYYSNSPSSEDLVSIGTIGLIKAVDSFKLSSGARFATYAARCIQNEILMFFRSRKKLSCEVSLSETIDTDRDGNPLTYMDVISSEESLEAETERKLSSAKALRLVDKILTDRERRIIKLRYGLDGKAPLTQREVAEKLAISRSYVSRIEKSALDKLKSAFTDK